jgi:hypothetical protein
MDSRLQLLGRVERSARQARELDPDPASQAFDPAAEEVEWRLQVFRVDLLRRDRPELRETEDRVLDAPDGDPERELRAALRAAGVDRRRRDHPAELARDPDGVLRGRRDGVRVLDSQVDPQVDVLCSTGGAP